MTDQPELETDRLLLRPFELSDAATVKKLAGDFVVADMTLNIPHPYEEGMAEEWIGKHEQQYIDGESATFAICMKPDGELYHFAIRLIKTKKLL